MVEILILDYNRPNELSDLLDSLDQFCQFDKKIVVLNNGGCVEKARALKDRGLIDKLIENPVNVGCGLGTIQLFSQCESEYAFYVQVDHKLTFPLDQSAVDMFIRNIEEGADYIDLAGDQGNGKYSERAQFISKQKYLMVPKDAGGPGPLDCLKWTEECVQDADLNRMTINIMHGSRQYPIFADCGYSSVRSNPDGSEWKHEPDTKRVFCLKKPKEKFSFPPLSDDEWDLAIKGDWPTEGKIIEAWKENSFIVWNGKG